MKTICMSDLSGQLPSHATRVELLAAFDGDGAFVQDLVTMFLNRCPLLVEDIHLAVRSGNGTAISRAAHSLKGSIAYFDLGKTYAAAEAIERTAVAEPARVPALVQTLQRRLSDLVCHLNAEFPAECPLDAALADDHPARMLRAH